MARTPLLPGWERVPGGGDVRRYRDPSGVVHTRREYDNARAQKAGFKDYNAGLRFVKQQKGDFNFQNAIAAEARRTGQKPAQIARVDSPLVQRIKTTFYRRDPKTGEYVPKDRSRMSTRPHGPLARFLESMGVRERGANYAVGDSPKRARAA